MTTPSQDNFEQELHSLTPRPVSPTLIPGMHARLARRTRLLRLSAAAFLTAAAACIAVYILLHPTSIPSTPPAPHIASTLPPLPTVANFRRALAQSPDTLDTFLHQTPAPDHTLHPTSRINDLEQTLAKF